jgi:integrase
MEEANMPTSDTAVRNAKPAEKPYKITDEKGLFLFVTPSGGKLWRLKYRFGGKEKLLSLGAYPDVPLKEARERRDDARKLLANEQDPGEVKKAQKAAKPEPVDTFRQVAEAWREIWVTHVSTATCKEIWANLERNIFPHIGASPVADVTTKQVIDCLRLLETSGRGATLRKAKAAISLIFKYAIQNGRGVTQNPVSNFDRYTFKKFKVHNFPTLLDPVEIGKLLRAIDAYHGTLPGVDAALRLAPILFQRIGELRTMKWADIRFETPEGPEWTYTVGKTDTEHNVPLPSQAVAILQEIRPLTGHGEYCFPSFRAGRPISNAAINTALEAMGYNTQTEITGHGFRAMAYTLIREKLKFPMEIVDFQLSHRHGEDKHDGAYARMEFREERNEMMQAWADYLDKLKHGADVIPLRA